MRRICSFPPFLSVSITTLAITSDAGSPGDGRVWPHISHRPRELREPPEPNPFGIGIAHDNHIDANALPLLRASVRSPGGGQRNRPADRRGSRLPGESRTALREGVHGGI